MTNNMVNSCSFLASLLLGVGLLTWFLMMRVRKHKNPNNLPLPPGPKGYPIIGNLFDVPSEKPWVVYDQWSKIYGNVVYFKLFGQGFLVLGDMGAIKDLLEKRSSNYSDRMWLTMTNELMGWDFSLGFQAYGLRWRRHRKMFHEAFHSNIVGNYQPIQSREVHAFLRRLLAFPGEFMQHTRLFFASTIMSIIYDIPITDPHDPYVQRAETALEGVAIAGTPGSFLVDVIPALKFIPSWFPGASFKRKAAHWKEVNEQVLKLPFQDVIERRAKGMVVRSVASSMIERLPPIGDPRRAEEMTISQNVAAVAFAGGADTTLSTVQFFFLAMAMHSSVQKKAQEEIDRVIGPYRLPEFGDEDSLPYLRAVIKEVTRWNMVVPLGVAHMATSEDEYMGYYIPAGTVVLGNGWSVLHDPAVFPDPLEFKPERFIKDGQFNVGTRDPDSVAFGYGRRICPGRHLSNNSLYAAVSSVLAVFDIGAPLDESGRPVQLTGDVTSGLLSYPSPFTVRITPRSAAAEALIRDTSFEGR